ncbi:MAG: hypothetical protein HDR03_08150 [Lachnospiraceae bacterium]|nr:hypothetical protein [Lachnospiraceae bacterium]
MGKNVMAATVISGADGPTSVFIAGKGGKRKLSQRIRSAIYERKRKRVAEKIVANPHALNEVVEYIRDKYNAVEVCDESRSYLEERNSLKASLVLKHKPELLGDMREIERPKEYNEETMMAFMQQVDLQIKRAEAIPDETFPIDFHIYEIRFSDTVRVSISVENVWEILSVSYSGDKKMKGKMSQVSKDIYLYYGVTEEDIRNKSERYSGLVTTLST